MEGTQFRYAIKFVADMDKAVKFYRDVIGLKVKFESPGWSEFVTGETTLALHPASDKNPAGKVELGFTVADVEAFYRDMSAKGVLFSMPPQEAGFRRGAGAVRRFRRHTLQRGRGGSVVICRVHLFIRLIRASVTRCQSFCEEGETCQTTLGRTF
jgi:lactoylglutathione lyase